MERIGEQRLHESWHLIEPDGTWLVKSAGALALVEHLRPATARLLRPLGLRWVVAAANTFLHRLRGKAGRFVRDVPRVRRYP